MEPEQFYLRIRERAAEIRAAAAAGDAGAQAIVRLYMMHHRVPNDPGALGLVMAAFDEWCRTPKPSR